MRTEIIETKAGAVSRLWLEGEPISRPGDFLELLLNCPTSVVAIDAKALADGFFDLKSGIAGELLQKVSNYRRSLIILGDFEGVPAGALKDFLYESNKTGKVIFERDLDRAINLLR